MDKKQTYQCSVVIPIYNGARFIPDLASSLCAQTYNHRDFRVVFVDNMSIDNTPTLLLEAKERLAEQDIESVILKEELEQTPSAARNTGIRFAIKESKIIVFIDADILPTAEWLSQILSKFSDKDVVMVAGRVESHSDHNITVFEEYANRVNLLSQEGPLNHHYLPFAQTANLAVSRDVFFKIGLFRTKLLFGEDTDFCWRMIKEMGAPILYEADAVVFHKHRNTLKDLCKQCSWHASGAKILSLLYPSSSKPHFSFKRALRLSVRFVVLDLPAFVSLFFFGKAKLINLIYAPLSLLLMIVAQLAFNKTQLNRDNLEIPYLS